MLTDGWRCIALFVLVLGDTGKTGQRLERLCPGSTVDADAARLSMWIVQSLVDTVDGPNAGVSFTEFGNPLVACLGLKDGTQHIHGLFAFAWANGHMEGQQFKMSNVRAKRVPELWLQSCQGDVLAIFGFINIVAGQTSIERGMAGAGSFAGVQIAGGDEWQK